MLLAALPPATDPRSQTALAILRALIGERYARGFSIALWDGTQVPAQGEERFELRVNAAHALRTAFTPPLDLNPGRAFVAGALDCRGDLEACIDTLQRALGSLSPLRVARIALLLPRLPAAPHSNADGAVHLRGRRHSLRRDRDAIGFHYDQPLEFYRAFLDDELVYSCAYFADGVDDLATAQRAKLDYTLDKLRVRPGDRLLDIGCGFGALILRAAERYGANALGITLSRRQFDETQRRIAERGLAGRASVELLDYRKLGSRTFDKIVSVGMVEHVGRERLDAYFRAVHRALRPGGLFLNHGIADESRDRTGYRSGGFMGRYVFPDGDLVPIGEMLRGAERRGFEVRDVENLREHYARTLRAWVANLERNAATATAATSERTVRIWRLYLAGSAQGFASGRMGVFQALLAKPDASGAVELPPTRSDLYRNGRLAS